MSFLELAKQIDETNTAVAEALAKVKAAEQGVVDLKKTQQTQLDAAQANVTALTAVFKAAHDKLDQLYAQMHGKMGSTKEVVDRSGVDLKELYLSGQRTRK